eukprot:CCRYP_001371-RA/>CCRYP_001371-RA protein AED:0.39 eAED:0.39 QI:0/0/0/1/1/1/2/0/283
MYTNYQALNKQSDTSMQQQGTQQKNTWLTAIRHGNYSTWPLITIKNVNKHFPQSEETQQGHMKNQRQGVRSTKQLVQPIAPPPTHPQQNDIYIKSYDTNNTLYTDQTGKFPHVSSRAIPSGLNPPRTELRANSSLHALEPSLRMKACNITPQHQVLDNEISAAYREAITTSAMTYQLVPPDDHRRNIAEKAIQTWKDHFVSALSGTADNFPSTYGVSSSHKWSANSTYSDNQTTIPRYHPMHTFMATMTTTLSPLFLSEWRHWSMTSPTAENHSHNTALKGLY